MTKLLVGVGNTRDGTSSSVEIIDLRSPASTPTCKNLKNFPLAAYGSFGGLEFQDRPVICGGFDMTHLRYSLKCYSLESKEWIPSVELNRFRVFTDCCSSSPFPSKTEKLFVIGGHNSQDSAEILTETGWKIISQPLPVLISRHCSVLVNSTTIMVIGGIQDGLTSTNTFYFNSEKELWTSGPQLKHKRSIQSCKRIRKDRHGQQFSIVVAGGWDGTSALSSVEILDEGSNEWRAGPELPFGIDTAQMVEDETGGVVLIGGASSSNNYLDTLFRLPHGGPDANWIQMDQKLTTGRNAHVAFLVPDNNVDC